MHNRLFVSLVAWSLAALAAAPAYAARAPQISLTISGGAPIPVTQLEGEEAISSLFHFTLEIAAEPAPFEAIGRPAGVNVALADGSVHFISGMVFRVTESARGREATARLEIVPRLWLLTRRAQSRIFQQMSVPEIVREVLEEGEIEHEISLAGSFPPREYVVQYRESDFAFVSRLMEEEGIYYYFRHAPDGETLVLANTPGAHPTAPGGNEIVFEDKAGAEGRIASWEKTQELRSGKYTLRDYDFELPGRNFEVSATIQELVRAGEVTHRLAVPGSAGLEIYDYPGDYAQRFDGVSPAEIEQEGRRTVAIRMEEETVPALTIAGAGAAARLIAGHRFTLAGHPNADGDYVVTSVRHHAGTPGKGGAFAYTNEFTCIPAGLPFRPARVTPRPVIAGTQTATVTGPAGEQIHTDEHARVKVQFHWDREGSADESSSRWVRVGALHAGEEDGWSAVPRIGDEVVVSFLEGDPDQPIIVGSAYNPDNPPPPEPVTSPPDLD